jgi:carbamoyltransferase
MNYIGISSGYHDAGVSVVTDTGEIAFAAHSERYSKHKHDEKLCSPLLFDALKYANGQYELHYYERPLLTSFRRWRAGQGFKIETAASRIKNDVRWPFNTKSIKTHGHHLSHAAAGFQTSPFEHATCVVIDAIGELDTISIWDAWYDSKGRARYKKLWSKTYPDSIGLFYSAMTQKVGLRPLDEEYILMGMAAYGTPKYMDYIMHNLLKHPIHQINFTENLHIGLPAGFLDGADNYDIASSTQGVAEDLIKSVMRSAQILGKSTNLVYGGGVALNCLANRLLGSFFNHIWIMPNPGDCGSSLGAAALGYGKKLNWKTAYLGYNIPGEYPSNAALDHLLTRKIVGVASGRAEFGPRALGNRSLLADPRGPLIKDQVNDIKQRQKFRPFAPVILEEHVHQYFELPIVWENSRYMQVIANCIEPDKFPAIVHKDGTSRVQTVPKDGSGIRDLLEKWYVLTECPMLLNTSLNIRNEPMVNDMFDGDRFTNLYGVPVVS